MSEISRTKPVALLVEASTLHSNGELQNMNPLYQLDGRNYLQWSQIVKTFLKGRGKISHLNGSDPSNEDLKFQAWDEEDSMIMSWFWNSMQPEINKYYMFLTTAKAGWDTVQKTYSKMQDAVGLYEIKTKISVSVQWKRLPTSNEPPAARAYHSMTCIGSRYLLFGGFDGKTTFGDLWWLVAEEDPIAKRLSALPPRIPENKDVSPEIDALQPAVKESKKIVSPVSELHKRLKICVSLPGSKLQIIEEAEDKEFLELASQLVADKFASKGHISHNQAIEAVRDHWRKSTPQLIQLKELGPLLRDYQRLIARHHIMKVESDMQSVLSDFLGKERHNFYHIKNVSQLRMDDIPKLLAEYKRLPSD